ncbi:MAG: hypothetical protein HWQ38_09710 [Nostoc sp. NMS7]|uniref:hypothetical protein n=1 Tax=Nostoc sp. NMS7 TaxID=2815391 RepID=UPI0025CED3B1|nr:hypothetical protein [Nostoc sp. NMS7]MBN3946745.1 hypothetical protein [Nostoc sp. NMS7]
MACWGIIDESSEFYEIFKTNRIPIRSIVPFVPRESGMPLCYMVLMEEMPSQVIERLSRKIYEAWKSECKNLQVARDYLIKSGLPLKTSHFSSVGSDDYFQMPCGAALNAALHFAQKSGF